MQHKKTLVFLTALITVTSMLALGELAVRIFSPTEYLYPRYQFSAEYGMIPFPDVTMTHAVPGRFKFTYTVNSNHCRGDLVAPDPGSPTVVVLGDSYSFGMGVDDGQEFPSVMRENLAERCQVANLASPGWGLTQQIRRFYDTGMAYNPDVVILQFCANDPDDNFANRVTKVSDGEFVYVDSEYSFNVLKKYLSKSIIQKSQLYNYFRGHAARAAQEWFVDKRQTQAGDKVAVADSETRAAPEAVPAPEAVYIELLETFSADLQKRDIPLIVISVDNQLTRFAHIDVAVQRLNDSGMLTYLEVLDWLADIGDYRSPEGHVWGSPAHAVIGNELARYVDRALARGEW